MLGGRGSEAAARLGVDTDASGAEIEERLADAHSRWTRRAEHPLTSRAAAGTARVVVRTCEGLSGARRASDPTGTAVASPPPFASPAAAPSPSQGLP